MEFLLHQFQDIWDKSVDIWVRGGWGMIAIAVDAFVMFALGVHVFLKLRAKGHTSISEGTWRKWIQVPSDRRGPVGALIARAVDGVKDAKDVSVRFQALQVGEIAPFDRDLRVMRICVTTAPLLGLFGTVTGMLATFGALAEGSGGEKTMGMIAKGISEALITTETGLVVALPGLFLQYLLTRMQQDYKAFLARLESACSQVVYRRAVRAA